MVELEFIKFLYKFDDYNFLQKEIRWIPFLVVTINEDSLHNPPNFNMSFKVLSTS